MTRLNRWWRDAIDKWAVDLSFYLKTRIKHYFTAFECDSHLHQVKLVVKTLQTQWAFRSEGIFSSFWHKRHIINCRILGRRCWEMLTDANAGSNIIKGIIFTYILWNDILSNCWALPPRTSSQRFNNLSSFRLHLNCCKTSTRFLPLLLHSEVWMKKAVTRSWRRRMTVNTLFRWNWWQIASLGWK